MRIECIAIGSELLTAGRADMNSVWLGEQLAGLGFAFHRKTVMGDDPVLLRALFLEALERSDFIICTGGLGPTFDDLTKEILADVFGAPLVEDRTVREDIMAFFAARGREVPDTNFKQALVPVGAEVLRNPIGTAPAIYWSDPPRYPGVRVVLFPGVPSEMKRIWKEQVEPRLFMEMEGPVQTLRMLVGSVGESALDVRTTSLRRQHGALDWTILAGKGQVELVARGRDAQVLEAARRDFQVLLGADLVCVGSGSLESVVLEHLRRRGETLAVAESMTGGLIQARLTAVEGASEVFLGGAVSYSGHAKIQLVGVPEELIGQHGTVSDPVTRAMAEGIRCQLGTAWGLAITGNAGPGEDRQGAAPVGTCIIAVAGPGGTASLTFLFPGERSDVQARSATWALDHLRRQILLAGSDS